MDNTESEYFIALSPNAIPCGDSAFVFDELSGNPVKLTYLEAAVLSRLNTFASAEEHIGNIAAESGRNEIQFIEQTVKKLAEKRLLLAENEIIEILKKKTSIVRKTKTPGINSFIWVTADRPDKILKSVKSYSSLFRKFERFPVLTVYDDSKNLNSRKTTEANLKSLASDSALFPLRLKYFGQEEKKIFTGAILKKLNSDKAIKASLEFALSGEDGANRNTAFLHQAGKMFVSTDDDTEGLFARHPDAENSIDFTSEQDPTDFFIYPGRKELLDAAETEQTDILRHHEYFLGRSAPEIILSDNQDISLGKADPDSLNKLLSSSLNIDCTLSGICGDSGMTHSKAVLTRTGVNADDIYSEKKYSKLRLFREILRVVRRPAISTGQFYMSTHIGFDNRKIPLPFFPKFRSADGLFGFLQSKVFKDSALGFIPCAVYHDPEGERKTPQSSLSVWQPGMADILAILASDFKISPGSSSREDNIYALGNYYSSFSLMSEDELMEYITEKYLPYTIDYINILADTLDYYGRVPQGWVCDIETMISFMEKHLCDPDFFVPSELRKPADNVSDTPLFRLKNYTYRYGELLKVWPEVWHAAMELSEK